MAVRFENMDTAASLAAERNTSLGSPVVGRGGRLMSRGSRHSNPTHCILEKTK
jgi:hypothetical protein